MKIRNYITIILITLVAGQASAQNDQDGWLKRNWNNMIARFNIYFNATQKLERGMKTLADKQKDDFNETIDVYPYGTEADAKSMKGAMEETMKKASKVIQNKPRSKWADDAYFIIGQTQFFSGDYFSARETFQFVNNSFTDEEIKAMSQLWLMKSYIQQNKLDDAEAIYGLLKDLKSPSQEFTTHLNLSAGDLLVKQGKEAQAIELLDKGLNGKLKNRRVKYRTHFVLGQLYLKAKKYKKANSHFVKVLRMNAPYEYVFHSNLGMAKAASENGGQGAQRTIKYLKRMLKDDKNIEYYDQIYFELAKLEFAEGNNEAGLDFMRQSAKSSKSNAVQQTKTYLFLADHHFTEREYESAQAYYDSAVAVIPDNYPESDKIKAKHSVLSKLIENIKTIKTQDSLLALSELDRDVLDKRIDKIIEEEAERKRLEKEAEEIRKEQERMNALSGGGRNVGGVASAGGASWYFYDQAAVARGENEFRRKWGNRKHADYWRFINKSLLGDAIPKDDDKENEAEENPDTYVSSEDEEQEEALSDVTAEKKKYYQDIPFSATAKLIANKKIQQAFLNNGKIYFDELKEYAISKINMSTLLNRYPSTIYKPEALFYLSKAETELGNESEAAKHARTIADDFPETPYNSVLNGKEIEEDNSDVEVLAIYQKMYNAFQVGKYDEVKKYKKDVDLNYPGNSIQGKIDYLYALTIGKTEGKEAYKRELEVVREAYAGTEIGEMAAYTLRLLAGEFKETTPTTIYEKPGNGTHYYVITAVTSKGSEGEIQLNNYNTQNFGSKNLITKGLIFGDRQLYYVKQFATKKDVMEYHEMMKSKTALLQNAGLSEYNYYPINEANFRTLVKQQKEEDYIKFFYKNYN